MSNAPVVLENVVVLGALGNGDSLSDRQDVSKMLIGKLVQFLCVI